MSPEIKTLKNKNNEYQHIEVLKRNRTKRMRYQEFFIEGVEPINQALANNWNIISFTYCYQSKLSDWAKDILANSRAEVHYQLSQKLMEDLSDKNNPSELIAIASMPDNNLNQIEITDKLLVLIFDRPSNHGNLGTIIRSANSFKADGIIVTGHCVDIYDPEVIRASLGSIFSLPVLRLESYKKLLPWFEKIRNRYSNFQIVGTSANANRDILDCNFRNPTALIIGNETYGMSRSYTNLSDTVITIPIYGTASSLNAACAASICLYEIDSQRRLD